MFDSVGDLPLHPLVIHAVVMSIPLTLLLSVLFAVPRTRRWARWPLALVAVGALGATLLAKESGEALQRAIRLGAQAAGLVAEHARLANQLVILVAAVAAVAVLAALTVGGPFGRGNDRSPTGAGRVWSLAVPLVLVLLAATASFWAYRVGDLGARAVWNPAGTVNYSASAR